MTQKIKLPSKEDFYNQYITNNLSIQELSEHYNVGKSTIDNWIKAFQITKPKELIKQCKERTNLKKFGYTNVALIPGYRKKTHFSIPMPSYEDFYKHYIEENMSRTELCEYYKVGKSTIDKWIRVLKIKKSQDLINKSIQNYMLKKYNVISYSMLKQSKEKVRKTNQKKFGKEYYTQTEEYQIRANTTKKIKNTYGKSKQEEKVYEDLLKSFKETDIIRQYRSEKYPFACDFYIKSLDLYIECHFSQFHNFKPFDINNSEHIKELKILQNKAQEINFKGVLKKQYDMIIKVWTKTDPLKLQTFMKNKLNYKIFYTVEDFNQWYKTI